MRFYVFFLVLVFISIPIVSFAGIGLGFGGKVVTMVTPPIVCPGQGIITITPAGTYPTTPYVIPLVSVAFRNYTALPTSWILGIYEPVMTPGICWIPGYPPITYPVFPITMYGTSLPGK